MVKWSVLVILLVLISVLAADIDPEAIISLEARLDVLESQFQVMDANVGAASTALSGFEGMVQDIRSKLTPVLSLVSNSYLLVLGLFGLLVVSNLIMWVLFIAPLNSKMDKAAKIKGTALDKQTKDIIVTPHPLKPIDIKKEEPVGKLVAHPIDLADSKESAGPAKPLLRVEVEEPIESVRPSEIKVQEPIIPPVAASIKEKEVAPNAV